jgi:phosphonopyruvate decarboxylase
MLTSKLFYDLLQKRGINFFVGVPDSLLKSFCAYITAHNTKANHIICANEGAAVAVAVGYHLATKKIPLVYMQNSGLGNAINPLLSLADRDVFSIPVLMVIGWRGEPGYNDEPQHKKQGRITQAMLEAMEIPYEVISGDLNNAANAITQAVNYMKENSAPFALVVRKRAFDAYPPKNMKKPNFSLIREEAIELIVDSLDDEDIVISTTGMTSRELFEYREKLSHGHSRDFLTIGGMGHASQIALGIALQKQNRQVFCLDGDGSAIMHMGSMAINGVQKCKNFNHIVINNGAHDSVGGQPTVGFDISFKGVAKAVGYETIIGAETREDVKQCIDILKKRSGSSFLEIHVNKGARKNLGRPTLTPVELKNVFMEFLN